jgi:hypothetical protein
MTPIKVENIREHKNIKSGVDYFVMILYLGRDILFAYVPKEKKYTVVVYKKHIADVDYTAYLTRQRSTKIPRFGFPEIRWVDQKIVCRIPFRIKYANMLRYWFLLKDQDPIKFMEWIHNLTPNELDLNVMQFILDDTLDHRMVAHCIVRTKRENEEDRV